VPFAASDPPLASVRYEYAATRRTTRRSAPCRKFAGICVSQKSARAMQEIGKRAMQETGKKKVRWRTGDSHPSD
ncbi:MAG: hypothetical protein WAV78_14215, partial [Xanthobacteraceae bacterium]